MLMVSLSLFVCVCHILVTHKYTHTQTNVVKHVNDNNMYLVYSITLPLEIKSSSVVSSS